MDRYKTVEFISFQGDPEILELAKTNRQAFNRLCGILYYAGYHKGKRSTDYLIFFISTFWIWGILDLVQVAFPAWWGLLIGSGIATLTRLGVDWGHKWLDERKIKHME